MVDVTSRDDLGAAPAIVPVTDTAGRKAAALATVIVGTDGNIVDPSAPVLAAGENHIGEVGAPADVIAVTPIVEATALDAGDVVFDTTIITNAARVSGGVVRLDSVSVIDTADQKAELHLVFFSANRSLGTVDGAPSINDTNVLDLVGYVHVAAADYVDLGGASIVQLGALGKLMKTVGSRNLYVAAFTPGTPTYGAADALKLLFGFAQG